VKGFLWWAKVRFKLVFWTPNNLPLAEEARRPWWKNPLVTGKQVRTLNHLILVQKTARGAAVQCQNGHWLCGHYGDLKLGMWMHMQRLHLLVIVVKINALRRCFLVKKISDVAISSSKICDRSNLLGASRWCGSYFLKCSVRWDAGGFKRPTLIWHEIPETSMADLIAYPIGFTWKKTSRIRVWEPLVLVA